MLHHVVTFHDKWQNLPILVISHKVIRVINIFLTRYYETWDFFFFCCQIVFHNVTTHICNTVYGLVYHLGVIFHKMLHTYVTWLLHHVITKQCYISDVTFSNVMTWCNILIFFYFYKSRLFTINIFQYATYIQMIVAFYTVINILQLFI